MSHITFLLHDYGFETNPYNWFIFNKKVNRKQSTVLWYVDNLKISHKDKDVETGVINKLVFMQKSMARYPNHCSVPQYQHETT